MRLYVSISSLSVETSSELKEIRKRTIDIDEEELKEPQMGTSVYILCPRSTTEMLLKGHTTIKKDIFKLKI